MLSIQNKNCFKYVKTKLVVHQEESDRFHLYDICYQMIHSNICNMSAILNVTPSLSTQIGHNFKYLSMQILEYIFHYFSWSVGA